MTQPLTSQSIRNLGVYGVIRRAEVDDGLIPEGAVIEAINFNFDRKGAAIVRPGITALGATVTTGNVCVGMHNALSSTLAVAFSLGSTTTIYRYNGSSWAIASNNLTSSTAIRAVDFANRTIFVNGAYDSIRVWNGSTSNMVTTGTPINPQQFVSDATVNTQTLRAKFVEVYKNRVYLAGDPTSPDRLFFSSVISSAGNITWEPSTDFVDINPNDGENITALKRFSLELDVFKPNYIYRFRTSGTEPDPLIKIGTRSTESIVEGKKGLYFHHDTGFYRYDGGYPVEISRPISDIIDAIPYSQFDDINGWKDSDHIYWSIGNITIGDTAIETLPGTPAWRNVVVRYTESSEVWTVYSMASEIRRGGSFNSASAGTLTRVVGLDNGVVATFNSGTTDLGEMIKFYMITKWYEYEGIINQKLIQEMAATCEKAQNIQVMYQTDNNPEWKTIGSLTRFLTFFFSLTIRFHRIRFKIAGTSKNEPPIFLGLEIFKGLNEGIVKQ